MHTFRIEYGSTQESTGRVWPIYVCMLTIVSLLLVSVYVCVFAFVLSLYVHVVCMCECCPVPGPMYVLVE